MEKRLNAEVVCLKLIYKNMDKILEKITRYNLFNYLVPGGVFLVFVTEIIEYKLKSEDTILVLFFAYFVGLVISRLGSVFVEPIFKKIKFIKFEKYKFYLKAVKKNPKLEILSEENNTYRTYTALFLLILIIQLVLFLFKKYSISIENFKIYIPIMLGILFALAYRKQTKYIVRNINKNFKK